MLLVFSRLKGILSIQMVADVDIEFVVRLPEEERE